MKMENLKNCFGEGGRIKNAIHKEVQVSLRGEHIIFEAILYKVSLKSRQKENKNYDGIFFIRIQRPYSN